MTSAETLSSLNALSKTARKLLADILTEGAMARRPDFEGRPGWEELINEDLINCWDDDAGNQYCAVGRQA